jgi:hypothetical protein
MALTYNDISAVTTNYIVPKIIDDVYKSSPLLTRLRTVNAERFEGGLQIQQPIMYAELKGGSFGRGDSFDTSYVQTDTAKFAFVQ